MQNLFRTILLFCFSLIFLNNIYGIVSNSNESGKDAIFFNSTKKVGIKTVVMGKENSPYAFPLIRMGSGERVKLMFDDLGDDDAQYFYEVLHCTWDWKKSDIDPFYYSDGIIGAPLYDFQQSFNTIIPYRHYSLEIPNSEVSLHLSGNYVVVVYQEKNGERQDVLIRRFCVAEDEVSVGGRVKRPVGTSWPDREQSLVFHVDLKNYSYYNAFEDFRVVALQNYNWHMSRTDFKPSHIDGRRLVYDREVDQVFPGINEFRYFASRNLRTPVANVREILFDPTLRLYRVHIHADEARPFTAYRKEEDINGSFRIDTRDKEDVHLRADYTWVHLSLNYTTPFADASVCIMSSLFSFSCDERNTMEYNFEKRRYELEIMLKQGYYDYLYGVKKENNIDYTLIEGSHYQTENEYTILFYDCSSSERHDRLIGVHNMNRAMTKF